MSEAADITEDAFLGGQLRLRQKRSGHRAGHDAILLAAATEARPGDRVVDFGAGIGTAGLALARRVAGIGLSLVEIDPELAELARANAAANALAAEIILLDVTADATAFAANGLPPDSVDAVLMNPPFNDPARHRGSPDQARHTAHVATEETLHAWVHAARRILRSNGVLTLIWRADGIADVLAALSRGFGSLSILPVHGEAGRPAIRVLVRAVKGGRAPTRLLPGLMLNDESGVSKKEVTEILEGRAALPLMEP
ncbi:MULTISPECIES: tRNA1(Val) (adenine(37)-N6)-methyltransferase [Bradyrhizobium]|jgi:tRNA1(Val) A37 N6-methylase TrmN6|uniref:tRNA1(Val) (adenine(37)-N6)-methyltransferase n=1 Tax=Bradyrhizobium TaxID=374 RepID=UPI0004B8EB2C|nr:MULTISPECIES: methyltransferase [Bradyrhizobium]MBR1365285.1 methyltransferase [Bradyrhizobium ottawaense]MDA9445319.1 methyltransferase [Bradyrhizobium sp. CCBAU 21360]MDA9454980.1 methyltransferase [Bradyrhizobium sp. CCBAU 21359]MDA9473433.1 methyltransferase [Bradyrhizobium sp. CCBAU 65884]MDA9517165.1 methyltransferase [Bradyrhizobium sp. CCBAU 11430]